MANGYFERGEMYDILSGDALVGEMVSHRPGIIVSSDAGNRTSPVVTIVFTTTTTTITKDISVNHRFTMRGKEQYALGSQLLTVNKKRLTNYYGKLSDGDMRAIDRCVEIALDLGYVDDTAVKEKEKEIAVLKLKMSEQSEETAKLNAKIAAHDDEITSLKIEIAMWQRLYEKALDQVCSMKLTGDIARRVIVETPTNQEPPVTKIEEPQKSLEEKKPELVDINSTGFNELKACGFSDNVILQIMQKRPHRKVEDLRNLNGLTNMGYQILSKKVCCVVPSEPPIEVKSSEPKPSAEKVNINTATGKEIMAALGVGNNAAYSISSYRKKNGLFTALEDLVDIPHWSEKMLEKYRDKLEV